MVTPDLFSRSRLAGYAPERMEDSVVLVVGVGALGQNVAQNLALSGVGELRLVDNDQFEDHNRTRSPAYPLPEERRRYGLSKARVVAHKLHPRMTATQPVIRFAEAWIQELGEGAFEGVSVVLSCVDNPRARAYLSDRTRLLGLPFIEGGFDGPEIALSCYPAVRAEEARMTPCWRCSHQEIDGAFSCRFYAQQTENAGFIPAIQNAAATLAGLQAEAAIMALHGNVPLGGCAWDLNVRTGKSRMIGLTVDPDCPGQHVPARRVPTQLVTRAEDSVACLLQELGAHLGEVAAIQLPAPLVWTAPCTRTGKLTLVRSPDWRWAMSPRSTEAGGPFRVLSDAPVSDSPLVYTELTSHTSPTVLASSCRDVGLSPRAHVAAFSSQNEGRWFSLSGQLDELFETVTPEDTIVNGEQTWRTTW